MSLQGKIKVVIFDLGDTLIYFDGDWAQVILSSMQALWQSLLKSGISVDEETFKQNFSERMRRYYLERLETLEEYTTACVLTDTLHEMGVSELPEQVIQHALQGMYAVSQQHWHLEHDAIETLEWLCGNGIRLGLISNASDGDDVHTLLRTHGMESYFEQVIISAETGIRKPHISMFEAAISYFGVLPKEMLMVGDKVSMDICGASNAGMQTAWISRRITAEQRLVLDECRPTIEIYTLAELKAYL